MLLSRHVTPAPRAGRPDQTRSDNRTDTRPGTPTSRHHDEQCCVLLRPPTTPPNCSDCGGLRALQLPPHPPNDETTRRPSSNILVFDQPVCCSLLLAIFNNASTAPSPETRTHRTHRESFASLVFPFSSSYPPTLVSPFPSPMRARPQPGNTRPDDGVCRCQQVPRAQVINPCQTMSGVGRLPGDPPRQPQTGGPSPQGP